MTDLTDDVIASRQWCIEKAATLEDDSDAMLSVAADLIALVETGRIAGHHEPEGRPLDFSTMKVGLAEDDDPQPASVRAEMVIAGNEAATRAPKSLPVKLRPSHINRPESAAAEPEMPPAPKRSVPRMPATLDDLPPCDLSEKDQAVLTAVTLLSAGGKDWPTHAQIAEASGVARGSLGYVMERLRDKGRLQRIDGKWVLSPAAALEQAG